MLKINENTFENVKAVLENVDYNYSDATLRRLLDKSLNNKARLLDWLSKMPNFNADNYLVKAELTINHEPNFGEARYQLQMLMEKIGWIKTWVQDEKHHLAKAFMYSINSETVTEINKAYIELLGGKCAVGQKLSRAINSLLEPEYKIYSDEGMTTYYNRMFATLSDSLKAKTEKSPVYFSINPVDYLTMSHGNSWTSCHRIEFKYDERGCYHAGTLSYMNDDHTIQVYCPDGDDLVTSRKIFRASLHCYPDASMICSLYGGVNYDAYKKAIMECWTGLLAGIGIEKTGDNDGYYQWYSEDNSHAYDDFNNHDHITIQYNPDLYEQEKAVGAPAYCLVCGERLDDDDSLLCYGCGKNNRECDDCGCRCDRDDMYYIESRDVWVCPDCAYYCQECGEYFLERDGDYLDDNFYCDHCLDRISVECQECGERIHQDDICYDEETDEELCNDCYRDRIREREEELENLINSDDEIEDEEDFDIACNC